MYAIACFNEKVKGTVYFTQSSPDSNVFINVNLSGLRPFHQHGFHIHEFGDLSDGCQSMKGHFNPYGKKHGGPKNDRCCRHVGDLGNIRTDAMGNAKYRFSDPLISLCRTKCNIIGRGLVIHDGTDDLGKGGDKESLITGNAGKRLAGAVIGHCMKMKH